MKKAALGMIALFFLSACSNADTVKYEDETFTLGNSLTYEMPVLESDLLQPSSMDLSTDTSINLYNDYWFLDEDNLLSGVQIEYRLTPLDIDYVPYYYQPENKILTNLSGDGVPKETVDINGRQWIHVEEEPMRFESEGEKMITINHDYYYRASFETYRYGFKWTAQEEEFDNQEKVANSYKKMEEILQKAEFTHEPTKTEGDILQVLNGTWESDQAGYLQFTDRELKWYKDATMQEDNVLLMEVTNATPLVDPKEDTEYANLELQYVTETMDGQKTDSNQKSILFVNFVSENNIVLVDVESGLQYMLNKVK